MNEKVGKKKYALQYYFREGLQRAFAGVGLETLIPLTGTKSANGITKYDIVNLESASLKEKKAYPFSPLVWT